MELLGDDVGQALDINALVAKNLGLVLGDRTPESYCKEGKGLSYVSGPKKGKKVAPRALRYVLDGIQAPRLDMIAAIASKEQLQPYQLLFFDFDPHNAPVMISKAERVLMQSIQNAARAIPVDKQ